MTILIGNPYTYIYKLMFVPTTLYLIEVAGMFVLELYKLIFVTRALFLYVLLLPPCLYVLLSVPYKDGNG